MNSLRIGLMSAALVAGLATASAQTVTAYVVAVEVAAHGNFAITTHAEALAIHVLHHAVCSHSLCTCRCQTGNQGSGHQINQDPLNILVL